MRRLPPQADAEAVCSMSRLMVGIHGSVCRGDFDNPTSGVLTHVMGAPRPDTLAAPFPGLRVQ